VSAWTGIETMMMTLSIVDCTHPRCRVQGCGVLAPDVAVAELSRASRMAQNWWTHDFFSCIARPPVVPRDPCGLPAAPLPMPFNASAMIEAVGAAGVQRCSVLLRFDTKDQRDPLTRTLELRARSLDRPAVAHLLWISSSWWCAQRTGHC